MQTGPRKHRLQEQAQHTIPKPPANVDAKDHRQHALLLTYHSTSYQNDHFKLRKCGYTRIINIFIEQM